MADRRKGNSGRKRIEIDESLLSKCCDIMCTQEEISHVLGISVDTLDRWCKREKKMYFAEFYKKATAGAKKSLRRSMFETAIGDEEKGIRPNPTLLIWLSKQHLGMTDQPVDESRQEVYKELPSLTQDKESLDD